VNCTKIALNISTFFQLRMHQMSFGGRAPVSLGASAPRPMNRVWPGEEVEIKIGERRRGEERGMEGYRKGRERREGEAAHPQKFSEVGACLRSRYRMKPFMSMIVNLLSYPSYQNVIGPFSILSYFLLILPLSHRFGRSPSVAVAISGLLASVNCLRSLYRRCNI